VQGLTCLQPRQYRHLTIPYTTPAPFASPPGIPASSTLQTKLVNRQISCTPHLSTEDHLLEGATMDGWLFKKPKQKRGLHFANNALDDLVGHFGHGDVGWSKRWAYLHGCLPACFAAFLFAFLLAFLLAYLRAAFLLAFLISCFLAFLLSCFLAILLAFLLAF